MARADGTAAVADAIGRASARPIQAATGGKGGEAFLVVGVILLGWLFVTRRLQRVVQVIGEPADAVPPSTGSLAPAPVAAAPGGGYYTTTEPGRRAPSLPPNDAEMNIAKVRARLRCGSRWTRAYQAAINRGAAIDAAIAEGDQACGIR